MKMQIRRERAPVELEQPDNGGFIAIPFFFGELRRSLNSFVNLRISKSPRRKRNVGDSFPLLSI